MKTTLKRHPLLTLLLITAAAVGVSLTFTHSAVKEGGVTADANSGASVSRTRQQVVASYGKLPLSFERNDGQTDAQVKFLARGTGYSLFLTGPGEAVMALRKSQLRPAPGAGDLLASATSDTGPGAPSDVLRIKLVGGNPKPQIEGLGALPGRSNYFIGNDPKKWHTNVSNYTKVKYRAVYPGVDLVYYGNQRQVEHDFVVAPGASPGAITLNFEGAEKLSLDAQGDLVLATKNGEARLQKPVCYQLEANGARDKTAGNYVLKGKNQVGFEIVAYDASKLLIIDPVLVYSTYLGGGPDFDHGFNIAVDSAGNAYVIGTTINTNFPTTPGSFDTTQNSFFDAFVTKLNPTGSGLVYSTYLGGGGGDEGDGITLDSTGSAYVTGETNSTDFPTTVGAFQTTAPGGGDAFVTKLNATGSALLYSTCLGGSDGEDFGFEIALDSAGSAYVTGGTKSTDFPTTLGAFQATFGGGNFDVFVTKLNAAGSAPLLYSTYLGGSGEDDVGGIALDSAGFAYVTGATGSTNFPTTVGAFQTTFIGLQDAFVTKLNPTGSGLVYSTYLGGDSAGGDIAVDTVGNAYVVGNTASTSFPTTFGAFQTTAPGNGDAFVTKLNALGSALVYSTYLGGSSGGETGFGIALDSAGSAYVTGDTGSSDFPTTSDAFQTAFGGGSLDAYMTKLNAAGSALVYSTYLGGSKFDGADGIAVDSAGSAYVTGGTESTNFPTTPGAFQTASGGGEDAFVTKISNPTDLCPDDPNKIAPGQCGCGVPDTDTDSDGTADCNDTCPTDPHKTAPGACGCGVADTDSDVDGVPNCHDNCPNTANPDQRDTNGDGVGDVCTPFQFPAGGQFVIGNLVNLTGGATVYFWGSQWSQNNPMTGGAGPNAFKGFEDGTTTPTCGGTWTSRPGNSSNPPPTVPQFTAVIVSSSIQKNGSAISGNINKVVVIQTNPGYGPAPGKAGTGKVVAILCSIP